MKDKTSFSSSLRNLSSNTDFLQELNNEIIRSVGVSFQFLRNMLINTYGSTLKNCRVSLINFNEKTSHSFSALKTLFQGQIFSSTSLIKICVDAPEDFFSMPDLSCSSSDILNDFISNGVVFLRINSNEKK